MEKDVISKEDFFRQFSMTGNKRSGIFLERKALKALMEEIYATGNPIYCDQSYYVHETKLDLVKKVGEHFHCDGYTKFESWRDYHDYTEYADKDGNVIWVITGGRYD